MGSERKSRDEEEKKRKKSKSSSSSRKRSSSPSSSGDDEGRSRKRSRKQDGGDGRDSKKEKRKDSKSSRSHHRSDKDKKSKEKHQVKDHKGDVKLRADFTELSVDDYFAKNNEFATWLAEKKKVFFSDLSSESARELFADFVKAWNNQKLDSRYYDGISSGPRTAHNWKIKR